MVKIINKYLYEVSTDFETLSEGAAVIYSDSVVSFASFVDNYNKTCVINYKDKNYDVKFSDLAIVVKSLNPNDGTPMMDLPF